ncbi:MAG: HDOD domain-containing protein, partial [Candidatus Hydrogenedentes bacterium]|nr:HDOD domain-containing protein [Candidatus Hydrogenedentota bacterium]
MIKIDVKQRISSLQQLPVLPHIAREILSSLDSGTVNWEELAAIAEFDGAMKRQFESAASKECRCPEGMPLEDQLAALGMPRVAQLTFERVAPALFDAALGHGLDMKAFWTHAFSVAHYADKIARKIASPYQALSYVAGLLHDIGKPALDRVAPGGYTRALDLVRQQGLYALEAERRELGADHTVAGKWLTEAWGVPSSVIFAIWLHHHPPGTLDTTPYPVELIEIVSLANFLAQGDALETPPQKRVASLDEQRYLRLGLERLDVLELIRDGKQESVPTITSDSLPAELSVPTESRSESSRLRYERNFYEALCVVHERMRPGMTPAAQLTLFVDGLRKAFSIPVGLCYLTDESSEAPVVLRWRSLEQEPTSVSTKDGTSTSLDALIATLDKDATGRSIIHRNGFIALPLLDGSRSVGQLIFQSGGGGTVLSDNFLNDLMRFVKSAGAALAHCKTVQGVHEEAESLAAAVWKQELTHRHDRRTERLISVGKMAAGAAHEINNPLAVISGKAQMLLANAGRPEDEKALETIVEYSQRASGILRDLLQFAQPNPPQLMQSRISYLVKTSVDRVRQKFADEGIQLIEEYAQDLLQISLDRVQMDQVFQNLLKNAVQ